MSELSPLGPLVFKHWTDRLPFLTAFAETHSVLQLGVGRGQRFGIDVDRSLEVSPSVVADLESPLPFRDDSFDAVYAFSVLEHIERTICVLRECYRVTRDAGFISILVPHFASTSANTDPTHIVRFGAQSFDYFVRGTALNSQYGNIAGDLSLLPRVRLLMLSSPWSRCAGLQRLINRNISLYEDHLCYVLRPGGIYVELGVWKKVAR